MVRPGASYLYYNIFNNPAIAENEAYRVIHRTIEEVPDVHPRQCNFDEVQRVCWVMIFSRIHAENVSRNSSADATSDLQMMSALGAGKISVPVRLLRLTLVQVVEIVLMRVLREPVESSVCFRWWRRRGS